MNWNKLIAGPISVEEITKHIKDPVWQKLREELKGKSLEEKYKELSAWLHKHGNSRAAQVQVTNYINALKRGGNI